MAWLQKAVLRCRQLFFMNPRFLTAEWRKLAIANYSVDPGILQAYLPYKTELDLWNGKSYVSLVGFRFMNTKLKRFSIPLHVHFEEVNLRFYVRYKDASNWKRGVTFIKEIVPKPALSFVANTVYKERYISLPMRHSWNIESDSLRISYHWKHKNSWNDFSVVAQNSLNEIPADSEEEFITEHYWGYTQINNKLTSEYGVEHPRWQTYSVKESAINVNYGGVYGNEFSFLNDQKPDSIMLAEGSEIAVLRMSKIQ